MIICTDISEKREEQIGRISRLHRQAERILYQLAKEADYLEEHGELHDGELAADLFDAAVMAVRKGELDR